MEVKSTEEGLLARLTGEIDHHSAAYIRAEIDGELRRLRPERLILDFGGVTFMDSSGVGLVMGRYRVLSEWGGRIVIRNLPPPLKRVMRLSGIGRIAVVEENSKGA